jgi:hypothetical protein
VGGKDCSVSVGRRMAVDGPHLLSNGKGRTLPRVNRTECDVDFSPLSGVNVGNDWRYICEVKQSDYRP